MPRLPAMTPRLATSVGIATLLSLAAISFGVSLVRRSRDVAWHYVSLERQLAEWAKKADESGIGSVPRQLAELANQRAVEEAKRQFAAAAAKTSSLAMQAVQARLEAQVGLVAELGDAFEDEFGRELKRSDTKPPRYDAGPAPTITSVGMPSTSNSFDSAPLRASPCGTASHGISAKYSSKLCWSRSELTKITSKSRPAAFTFLYVSTSFGVNPRQGGHQCAEK